MVLKLQITVDCTIYFLNLTLEKHFPQKIIVMKIEIIMRQMLLEVLNCS